jgi:hypothetical protein
MFIIAGISPKTKILDNNPRICPACGLAQACLKRVDSYFNLFFIPLIRVKKGEPFIICDRCESMSSEMASAYSPGSIRPAAKCNACGQPLDQEFRYCPHCGNPNIS